MNLLSYWQKNNNKTWNFTISFYKFSIFELLGDSSLWVSDWPNKYHCPDEPIKYHRPPRPSMDDCRSTIKRNIQYFGQLRIGQEDRWRPTKGYIEWDQRHYKRSNYATMNRVQQLEGEKMYIRYTSEINKVHTHVHTHTHTHMLKHY